MIIGILTAVTQACKCLTSCVKEFEKKQMFVCNAQKKCCCPLVTSSENIALCRTVWAVQQYLYEGI